jgi:pimeloyl-ACP methyl ester carboxylesterase
MKAKHSRALPAGHEAGRFRPVRPGPLPGLLLALGILLGACGPSQPAFTPTPEPTPRPTRAHTSAFEPADCQFPTPVDAVVDCGYLVVPEDRSQDGSGGAAQTIRLHVAIFPSSSPDPEPDPLIYLHGGPGAGVLQEIAFWYSEPFQHIVDQRDFIVFDQRGAGYSRPNLGCLDNTLAFYESLAEDQRLGLEEWEATHADACYNSLIAMGISLPGYTSAASAADIEDLRVALGYEQVNLYGSSYGTRLALTALRDFGPQGTIRSVILDSVYPLQVDLYAERAPNAQHALQTIFDTCAADATCSADYGNLEERFYALLEGLDAEPVTIKVPNPVTGEQQDVVVNGNRAIEAFYRAGYFSEWIALMPQMIDEMEAGGFDLFADAVENLYWVAYGIDQGAYFSVQCSDEAFFSSPEAVDAASARVQPLLRSHFTGGTKAGLAACATWDTYPAALAENQPVKSDVPTLILAGSYDPITPPAWSLAVAGDLENAAYFEFSGAHGVLFDHECARVLAGDFVEDPSTVPSPVCLGELQELRFARP